jgi:hypothetical protein
VPSSKLSLHGLSGTWPRWSGAGSNDVLLRQPDTPSIWYDPAVEDSELVPLDDADWEADRALWRASASEPPTAAARLRARRHRSPASGEPCSLRWIYVHMIEEYARHNGHADLIRELVDGSVGT